MKLMEKTKKKDSVGDFVRHWRKLRRLSQMDLAFDIGISPKHLSFVETGRSKPSREMVAKIGSTLRLPLRQQNALLSAAGFAPEFVEEPLEGANMAIVREALSQMLKKHEPFPAYVYNSSYKLLMTNSGFESFAKLFIEDELMGQSDNILQILFTKNGLKKYIKDWNLVKNILITRIYEEILSTQNVELAAIYEEIMTAKDTEENFEFQLDTQLPVLPLSFEKDSIRANFFTMITTLGTPLDLTTQEMRIELLFPSDEITKNLFTQF